MTFAITLLAQADCDYCEHAKRVLDSSGTDIAGALPARFGFGQGTGACYGSDRFEGARGQPR
ncbi:hypothetical protein [Streptomonospora sp. PA3]|uniref:hypothetical protein n=1 Tax=Streptomonospora sp. PA3 TaxID=2607326 RepID=UPI0012DD5210|nr:hypothetical protein [Streptomonospora sp. PA3]